LLCLVSRREMRRPPRPNRGASGRPPMPRRRQGGATGPPRSRAGDVTAAADDHIFRAVTQRQEPVRVHAAEIAGMEPAATQCFRIGRRVLPIAVHHAVTFGDYFPDLAGPQVAVLVIDDAYEDATSRVAA